MRKIEITVESERIAKRASKVAGCVTQRRPIGAAEWGGDSYSRLFADLPALGSGPELLRDLGREGGVCDEGTSLREAPPATGWPFFGQFVAHDITADRSPLERTTHSLVANHRASRLNLESLYGAGPGGSPDMFDGRDPAKFLQSEGGRDVPRTRQGTAIIADPRNDSHPFMAAMHLALFKAHNAFVDAARARGLAEHRVFDVARQKLTWHYQWSVSEVFLATLVGDDLMSDLRAGRVALPMPEGLALPVEFADAACRYGHSQSRQSYRLKPSGPELSVFPDLLGFRRLVPDRTVDWRMMFDGAPDVIAQWSTRISERLPMALITLPPEVTGAVKETSYLSLANRDMQRGVLSNAVRRGCGLRAWRSDAGPRRYRPAGLARGKPLWYYIAREVDPLEDGDRLGFVGGRIVAAVLMSLLERDPASYIRMNPDWRPEISSHFGKSAALTLLDLLLFGESAPARS